MVEGQHDHAGAEPDAPRPLRRRAEEHGRPRDAAVLVEVVLGDPEGVEAPLLGGLRLLEQLGVELAGGAAELGIG